MPQDAPVACIIVLEYTRGGPASQSHSSVGQSATLIMWRSAVQPCLGLPRRAGGLAQLARAPALQAGGRRFESVILHGAALKRREHNDMLRHGARPRGRREAGGRGARQGA